MGTAPRTRPRDEYLIDDLAQAAGTTVRNVRAYQDRGLLPRADRRGRANVYDASHLERLQLIAGLLDRGHTLAGIKELLDAWEDGSGLGGVLGLVAEVTAPWSDEKPGRITRAELRARFGGVEDPEAIAAALRLGVLEREAAAESDVDADHGGRADDAEADAERCPVEAYRVPSPAELEVAAQLYDLGVPLAASIAHLEELRRDIRHVARRFVQFSAVEVFSRYLGPTPLSDADAARAAEAVHRLRPLAQAAVDAELARAMRSEATLLLEASVKFLPSALGEALAREL
ncbi:MerR family transcriptional regulator [Streptacidiphilus sp. NEAU-YB345]|uniref:MerR family transcriptional regulator n=2 Tax=Streptacidiphilus fuscans TaxID=2789292 RepID=A0A931FGD1_9ACTN|nr:MerR family transcriptional regulator [Streptacidiphilus fuscans]